MTLYYICADCDEHFPSVIALPDTALLLRRMPFFIPDFAEHCLAQPCWALRITRLGRSIHERFAARYYDATQLTLAYHFEAHPLLERLREEGKPWDMAVGFDGAVALAEPSQEGIQEDEEVKEVRERANKAIALVSSHHTLRQGDVFLFPRKEFSAFEVFREDKLVLQLQGKELASFHVK